MSIIMIYYLYPSSSVLQNVVALAHVFWMIRPAHYMISLVSFQEDKDFITLMDHQNVNTYFIFNVIIGW